MKTEKKRKRQRSDKRARTIEIQVAAGYSNLVARGLQHPVLRISVPNPYEGK